MILALAVEVTQATREVQWNVTSPMLWFMYASMVAGLGVFGWGCWTRVRVWRVGKREVRWDRPMTRLWRVLVRAGAQRNLVRDVVPGLIHAAMYFGVLALFGATVVVMIHHDLGIPIMRGRFYLYGQSLAVNALGAVALLGVIAAAVRRYAIRPSRLERPNSADAGILATFAAILVTGFFLSGLRIVATEDPWGSWRPFSVMAGAVAKFVWSDEASLRTAHQTLWVGHVALWHVALGLIPFSKMFHVVSSSASVYFAPLDGKSRVPRIDFDSEAATEVLGIRTPLDMTWKQLLDLDACTECGRCQDACPAWAEQKPLSPKRVILDLRDHVRTHRASLLEADRARRSGDKGGVARLTPDAPALAGGVIAVDTLWACTTCRACEEACPVSIEHVRLIVQLRQQLVMEQGQAPAGIVEAQGNMETRGHPFRGVAVDRSEWYRAGTRPGTERTSDD